MLYATYVLRLYIASGGAVVNADRKLLTLPDCGPATDGHVWGLHGVRGRVITHVGATTWRPSLQAVAAGVAGESILWRPAAVAITAAVDTFLDGTLPKPVLWQPRTVREVYMGLEPDGASSISAVWLEFYLGRFPGALVTPYTAWAA